MPDAPGSQARPEASCGRRRAAAPRGTPGPTCPAAWARKDGRRTRSPRPRCRGLPRAMLRLHPALVARFLVELRPAPPSNPSSKSAVAKPGDDQAEEIEVPEAAARVGCRKVQLPDLAHVVGRKTLH